MGKVYNDILGTYMFDTLRCKQGFQLNKSRSELIDWLMMYGAMHWSKEAYRFDNVPLSNTAAGLVCYEETA